MNEQPFQLLHGDCLELMREIPDKSVDMILCDLPYGTTACKWDTVIPLAPLWEQYKRICNGAVVLTASQPFTSYLVMSNTSQYRYSWVWEKPNASNQTMAKAQPLRVHEDVLVFHHLSAHNMATDRMMYNPQGLTRCSKTTRQGCKVSENLGQNRTRKAEYIQERF
jgi:site-specific DNA-methyltransferase (adenine-specific)